MRFPRFGIRDMVESQHLLLTRVLKIPHLHAVMGISMGGMQTFEWVVAYPDFMDVAIPIVGSPKLTSYDLQLWEAEEHIIEEDRNWNAGSYASMPPLKALADLHDLNLTTPKYRVEHTTPSNFASYMEGVEKNGPDRFDANNWLRQLQAMMDHDVSRRFDGSLEKAAKAVKTRMLVVVAVQDHMVNPSPAMRFAKLVAAPILELVSDCGHLSPGCEASTMAPKVHEWLRN
jgi:homoserine O-acetyltransferase